MAPRKQTLEALRRPPSHICRIDEVGQPWLYAGGAGKVKQKRKGETRTRRHGDAAKEINRSSRRVALVSVGLADLHSDLLRLGLFALRQRQPQDAVLELRVDGFRVDV